MNLLNLSEVAEMLRIGPEAVRRLAKGKNGEKPRLRGTRPGKEWLFDPEDVMDYIKRGYNLPERSGE